MRYELGDYECCPRQPEAEIFSAVSLSTKSPRAALYPLPRPSCAIFPRHERAAEPG